MTKTAPDQSRAGHLRQWVTRLRALDGTQRPVSAHLRMIHPGVVPVEGGGLIAAEPQGLLQTPGEGPQAITLLRYLTGATTGPETMLDQHAYAATLGALVTLVTNRRCNVVPEMMAKVEGHDNGIAIPLNGQIDSVLGAPMPAWADVDNRLRDAVARIASLNEDDAAAISAAIHLHYCASLLISNDLAGAYSLAVGGIECLAQQFGRPPTDWTDWDEAPNWDAFINDQHLTQDQAHALRVRLMTDKHLRLTETFATYATERLRDGFWAEPVQQYLWTFDAHTGAASEGTVTASSPRDTALANDPATVKRAFKQAYQARSKFLHVGKLSVSFIDDAFGDRPDMGRSRPSMANLRAALRALILTELREHGDASPHALDQIMLLDETDIDQAAR